MTPFQTHYFSENLVGPGIEPGITGSVARSSDHYITETVPFTKIFSLIFQEHIIVVPKEEVAVSCGYYSSHFETRGCETGT
jgi:hypothetical protein